MSTEKDPVMNTTSSHTNCFSSVAQVQRLTAPGPLVGERPLKVLLDLTQEFRTEQNRGPLPYPVLP